MVLCILMNRKNILFIKIEIVLIQSMLVLEPWLIGQYDLKTFSLPKFCIENISFHLNKCKLYCACT